MNQDLEKIKTLAFKLIPIVKKHVESGEQNIPLDSIVIEFTGKDPMIVQKDLNLNVKSMHATVMLSQLGQELAVKLKESCPDNEFKCISIWGRSPILAVSIFLK